MSWQPLFNQYQELFLNREELFLRWYVNPSKEFGGVTPEIMMENGKLDCVINLLEQYLEITPVKRHP